MVVLVLHFSSSYRRLGEGAIPAMADLLDNLSKSLSTAGYAFDACVDRGYGTYEFVVERAKNGVHVVAVVNTSTSK